MKSIDKHWLLAEYWATKAALDVAQSALIESGAIGVELDDGIGPDGQHKNYNDQVLIKAYFEPQDNLEDHVTAQLHKFFNECDLALGVINFSLCKEENWQENFVRSCTTFTVDPDIFIVPSFEIESFKKNSPDKLFIEMDPENAFGTGQHQTTKLCLTALHTYLSSKTLEQKAAMHCLDVGCGSGILAILMKKLGSGFVYATEIDGDALCTAKKNAQKNNVAFETKVVDESYRYENKQYDLVVANILAPPLISMAKNLCLTLRSGGVLMVSGILSDQADDVIEAYQQCGVQMIRHTTMDDWSALVFKAFCSK